MTERVRNREVLNEWLYVVSRHGTASVVGAGRWQLAAAGGQLEAGGGFIEVGLYFVPLLYNDW
jgi:hypothetical protein